MSNDVDRIDTALSLIREARKVLEKAGIPEQLFPLTVDVAAEKWSRSFWQFGSDTSPFIQIEKSATPHEIIISFGVVWKRGFFQRIWDCICECFAILWCRERTYAVHLHDQQVTEFKNLLRQL